HVSPSTFALRTFGARWLVAVALLAGAAVVPVALSRAGAAGRTPGPLAPAEGVLFGAHVQTPSGAHPYQAVIDLESRLGRSLAIDHYYHPFDEPFPDGREAWDVSNGRIPMISWGKTYTSEVNSGRHDDLVRTRARSIRDLGQPVLVRWFWEMGGNRNAGHAGTASDYIAAWNRLRRLFAEEGASNAVWVWCPDASDFNDGTAQAFYPGDEAVDWTCADGYNFRHPARRSTVPRSFEATFASFYAWAVEHPKPIMIGEYGTVEDAPGDKAAWVEAAREALKSRFPAVAAVVYFHSLRERDGFTYDWRMDSSEQSLAAFAAMGADPWFNPAVVRTLPDTVIDTGPQGTVRSGEAVFAFSSSEGGSAFQCRLDGGSFEGCSSPRSYPGLADGAHTFEARALSADGRPDPTAARLEWVIDTTPPAVVSTEPADGAANVDLATAVSAGFSEDLDPATVGATAFTLVVESTGMPVAGRVTYDAGQRRAVFIPESDLLPLMTYRAELAANVLTDGPGNRMAEARTWRFTTGGPAPTPAAPAPPAAPPATT
ncbi:MAG: Ig-like domain-containing protein, partial [Actinomycetota bacterium]|nr:Ig-like domain-containing protein [Actinomycetota bacterium]